MKLLIKSPIDFIVAEELLFLLGLENKAAIKFKANEEKTRAYILKLRHFDIIEIHCNLVEPSITNHTSDIYKHEETEILYSVFPNIGCQSKINDKLIHYVPIRKGLKQINEIIVTIKDEKGNLLKNEGANNIFTGD